MSNDARYPQPKPMIQHVQISSSAQLTAKPTQGSAPLSVTFIGGSAAVYFGGIQIDFGDGEQAAFCGPGRACSDVSVAHIYNNPGAYTVRLLAHGEGQGPNVLASLTITAQ
jgi:PKD repeat protein